MLNQLLVDKLKRESIFSNEGCNIQPRLSFGISNQIINKNVEFVNDDSIVFISGCNLTLYNLKTRTSKFIIRKSNTFDITSLSVGYKTQEEPYICLGEYNRKTSECQITTINASNPTIQNTLITSNSSEWKVTYAVVLNNSSYCMALLKKQSNPRVTRLCFWKFTSEKLIAETEIEENILYCTYNPRNPLELVLCGRGYLRLWNVFINEASLKEHPQRFLKGKQEREKTFIKAQFFTNKSFMLVVGTTENMVYLIKGFQVMREVNVCYKVENFVNLRVDEILNIKDEHDIRDIKNNLETSNKEELQKHLKRLSILGHSLGRGSSIESEQSEDTELITGYTKTSSTDNKTNDVFTRLYQVKRDSVHNMNFGNPMKTFHLLNNNYILITFTNEPATLLYKIEKKPKANSDDKNEDESDFIQNGTIRHTTQDCKVMNLANNVRTIVDVITNSNDQIVYLAEISGKHKQEKLFSSMSNNATSLCLYSFSRNGKKITFDKEIFSGYFNSDQIISLDYNEKKKIIYALTDTSYLRCYDCESNNLIIDHSFEFQPRSVLVSTVNNLFGICFDKKFCIYALVKNKIVNFCEFDVNDPYAHWSLNGDLIAVSGESRVASNKTSYNIYFIDTFNFETVHVIENIPSRIKKIKFISGDRFIFALLENSAILGWNINREMLTYSLMSRLDELGKSPEDYQFKLYLTHFPKNFRDYSDFDYDPVNDLLLITYKDLELMSIYANCVTGRQSVMHIKKESIPKIVRIVPDLRILLCGTEAGALKVFRWPFDFVQDKELNSNEFLLEKIHLHKGKLDSVVITRNLKNVITSSSDGSLLMSDIYIINDYTPKKFDFVPDDLKPKIEELIKQTEIYEYKSEDIRKLDENVEILNSAITKMKLSMKTEKDEIIEEFASEIRNMKSQLEEAVAEENKKYNKIKKDHTDLTQNVENELTYRVLEHQKEKENLEIKYKNKIQMYDAEIERLKRELDDLKKNIEARFTSAIEDQQNTFLAIFTTYNAEYNLLKEKIEESIKKLTMNTAMQDEAVESIISDYEQLVKQIEHNIKSTLESNTMEHSKLKENLEQGKIVESSHRQYLDSKVNESDRVIMKNAQIKQNIIDTTQRTITFQEQLLETEKNLEKIDKKLEDLVTKNKHLEQIRFVLEHRMTALEKEKAPLEGQCTFLEKKKENLQEEFNKLILLINSKNQQLEINQSQLRASLMQNFEINDQVNYVEKKINHLKNEIKAFIIENQSKDLTLRENKAAHVALKLRQFYDKYFSTNIEEELKNYQYYSQKLQIESERMNIGNNFDLIMRDKAEEKLICEDEKLAQLKSYKIKGFNRMQNENTILITECIRLRKNLHEVYMHVVDIEQKFENLTKINPNLNKSEIVHQIKNFIRQTHNKIQGTARDDRSSVSISKSFIPSPRLDKVRPSGLTENLIDVTGREESKIVNIEKFETDEYEGFIKLPQIRNRSIGNVLNNLEAEEAVIVQKDLPKID